MTRVQLALTLSLALIVSAPAAAQHHSGGGGGFAGGHMHGGGGFAGSHMHGGGGHMHSGFGGGNYSHHQNIGIGGGFYGAGLYGFPFGYGLYGYPFGYGSYYSSLNYYRPYGSSLYYGYGPLCYSPSIVYSNYNYNGYGLNGYASTPYTTVAPYGLFTLQALKQEEERRWRQDLQFDPGDLAPKPLKQSSAEERLAAREDQVRGDGYFREQKFPQARTAYLRAIHHAEELPEPYFRMAVAFAAQADYSSALRYLKRALDRNPKFPDQGVSISDLFGDDNVIARDAMYSSLIEWVQEDIRDPERLLLMGALLYGDSPRQAVVFLETSARLSGDTHYVAPYLAKTVAVAEPAKQNPAPQKHVVIPGDPSPHVVVPEGPVPPEPEKDQTDLPPLPLPNEGTGQPGEAYQPIDLGFTLPRHGRFYRRSVPTADASADARGPAFPLLGN